jgi:hypothetical protein
VDGDAQENGSKEAICKFTADKGVKFKVMDKVRACKRVAVLCTTAAHTATSMG